MYNVVKRDGKLVNFDIQKISDAIKQAFDACQKAYNQDVIDFLALKVTADFTNKIEDGKITVENIQDSVESVLIKAGYDDVAKAYIIYRRQREKVRNINATMVDYKAIIDNYLNIADWRVKENSTVTYSVGGLILSNSGAVTATIGFLKSMMMKLAMLTAMLTFTSTTFLCLPATVQVGHLSSLFKRVLAVFRARLPLPLRATFQPFVTKW